MMLLLLLSAHAADYTEATKKAAEAAYVQTGAKYWVDRAQSYGTEQVYSTLRPSGLDKVLGAGVYGYSVYRHQCLRFRIHNDVLELRPQSVSISIPF